MKYMSGERETGMPDEDSERYQQSPREFREALWKRFSDWRWLSEPRKETAISQRLKCLKPLERLKKVPSTRLFSSLIVVGGVCLLTYFIKCNDPESPKNFAALLFDNAEGIAIISAGAIYIFEAEDRKKRDHYEAWQVINSARGQGGSGGRIQALEDLNRDDVDLEGLSAPEADLSGINLRRARLERANLANTELDAADLSWADLQRANLQSANLKETTLYRANLQKAVLEIANLQGANLRSADLQRADLRRANLQDADLRDANLEGADLAEASLKGAFLFGTNLQGTTWGFRSQGELDQAELCRTTLPDGSIANCDCKEMGIDPETGSWITPDSSDAS